MTDKIFDEFIKQKLANHSAPVPADMWQRIMQDREPRKPAALFNYKTLLSIFLLVAVTGLIGYLMYKPATNDTPVSKSTTVVTGNQQPGIQNKGVTPERNQNNMAQQDDATLTQTDAIIPNKVIIQQVGPSFQQINQPINSKLITTGQVGTPSPSNDQTNTISNNYTFTSGYASIAKYERLLNNHNHSLQLKSFQLSCSIDCPTARGPVRNDWYIEAFASPDYAIKNIAKNDNIDPNYFARKDSTERMRTGFSAGIRISKTLNENMLIKTGLQFSQINEKFTYRTENERRLTTVVTIRTIIRAPGDTVRISDTSTVEQIGYREKITYNKYRSIDIPITVSYEWGNTLRKSINAGVLLNLHSWQQGEMLDTSYVPVAFNKAGTQTFKANIGVGLYLGFSVLKPIGAKTEIFAEPYVRYNISNMTADKTLFNQKFTVTGINLGVRYKIAGRQHYFNR